MSKDNVGKLICNTATGHIKSKFHGDIGSVVLQENEVIITCPDDLNPSEYYYDDDKGEVVEKDTFEDGRMVGNEYFINLPEGTRISWQGKYYTVDDGELILNINQVGTFNLWLSHPFYHRTVKKVTREN